MGSYQVSQKINKKQIGCIYTLANELGLVDKMVSTDDLHAMVESITGKKHIKDLSSDEAGRVIDRLKSGMRGTNRMESFRAGLDIKEDIPGMRTIKQIKMIRAQMYELKKYDIVPSTATLDNRLAGILKKYHKVDNLRFLSYSQAWRFIETLKGIVKRAKSKAEEAGKDVNA